MSTAGTKPLPSGMPHCLKKRRLLNEKEVNPTLCREYGEKFYALGWWDDALEFFQRGNFQEGLEKIKAQALESGDAYLLARLGRRHDPALWRQVAGQARKQGKLRFALKALEMAGDTEQKAEVARLLEEEQPPAP